MNKSKLGYALLVALEKTADGYLVLEYLSKKGTSVFYTSDLPKSHLSMTVSRLSKKGFIEKSFKEGQLVLLLSQTGKDWMLKYGDVSKWDGLWRIVIFDIPEDHKNVRNILRRRLKEWGFEQWQKSVWAGKKPLTEELRKLVLELKIERWVLVIESNNVGDNNK